MSDESSASIRDTRKDWITEHRDMYFVWRVQGHIMDVTPVGGRSFATYQQGTDATAVCPN